MTNLLYRGDVWEQEAEGPGLATSITALYGGMIDQHMALSSTTLYRSYPGAFWQILLLCPLQPDAWQQKLCFDAYFADWFNGAKATLIHL